MKLNFKTFTKNFFRYFKATALIVLTFLITSWGVSGVVSIQHNYTHKVADPFESFDFLYDKPWQRVGTYIMGES